MQLPLTGVRAIVSAYTLGFPLIWTVLRPTHGWLPFAPMIDTPKGFSSKMTLEVAPRCLDIVTFKV